MTALVVVSIVAFLYTFGTADASIGRAVGGTVAILAALGAFVLRFSLYPPGPTE